MELSGSSIKTSLILVRNCNFEAEVVELSALIYQLLYVVLKKQTIPPGMWGKREDFPRNGNVCLRKLVSRGVSV
jgi:hypothetical protein